MHEFTQDIPLVTEFPAQSCMNSHRISHWLPNSLPSHAWIHAGYPTGYRIPCPVMHEFTQDIPLVTEFPAQSCMNSHRISHWLPNSLPSHAWIHTGYPTGYRIPCPVMHEFTQDIPLVTEFPAQSCMNSHRISHWLPNSLPSHAWIHTLLHKSMHPFAGTFSKRGFHHEEFVGERYIQWNDCCSRNSLSYDTKINGIAYKMIGLSILLPLTLFHKHREHFVHKCMAFHSTNGYWKDWLVLCLISIIATCRLGYIIRKIRDQSFQPYLAWVWTAKKGKNTAVLKAGHDTPN